MLSTKQVLTMSLESEQKCTLISQFTAVSESESTADSDLDLKPYKLDPKGLSASYAYSMNP